VPLEKRIGQIIIFAITTRAFGSENRKTAI
jgi:hypothetical protein